MTYKELQNQIDKLTEEQKNCDVTVLCLDQSEIFPVLDCVGVWEDEWRNPSEIGMSIPHLLLM